MSQLKHFSLCSGIGGLDLASEWAGFKTVAQCEINEYASKVLAKNFKEVPNLHDIRTVTNKRLREQCIDPAEITVISAGFPCQPYSLAGKGLGDSDERDLWGEVARVLKEVKPKWFVGENTPGLFTRENQRYFRRILNDLTALGYSVGWGIWGACDVGAPHKRDRVFIVAHANSKRWSSFRVQDGKPCKALAETPTSKSCRDDWIFDFIPDAGSEWWFRSAWQTYGNESNGANNGRRAEKYVCGEWWQTEPDVGRVANGIPARVDRLRCLGNAVVPYQAFPIFKAIAEEESKNE